MADNKRQNAGGKAPVATPNMGPSNLISLESALSGAIGARIRLQTNVPSQATMEGTLFTACPFTNLVAIAVATSPNNPPTQHILPISSIQNFTIISTAPGPNGFASPPTTIPAITNLPIAALLARADAAVARLKEVASRKNKAVGKEAQDLFDGLTRTLPTRWDGNNIVVLDSVVISPPYRGEDCRAGNGAPANALNRVQKMVSDDPAASAVGGMRRLITAWRSQLDNERRRLTDRERKVVVPAIPAIPTVHTGPRKGG
ncbi:MAG: hypothetical protein Q9220_000664 [cf. Caloplaca sp. 1 TL-2023]